MSHILHRDSSLRERGSSYAAGTDLVSYGFQEPYLRAVLGLIGVSDITFIRAANSNEREDSRRQSLAKTHDLIRQMTTTW
ncbi:hypothetical protein D0962_26625 [Leptolyngbyaceae cyanobacterium CCMR0082]|uniref:FMN-dependent NADH-azoreductase n=2 Tax=Adonisia turfae TaxID=2950184 RepID=A0A6M0SF71_9CYAN|nr:hypothetical protein [Adonisia turfae]MDV3347682.1 hypothetical protein [Leptothoe sp. LEGE 181152]NEZ57200.1 hypothetical protein [Adonisia turfae CCMR0081]NEZ66292.1 hypothetical protein [Adonisia turfae CCMR0082]